MKNSNKDLNTINTKQLAKLAKRFGVKNASKTKKADLVALLETARTEREAKKNAPKPPKARQVYKRNGILHICFKGKYFAPIGETNFKNGFKVRVLDYKTTVSVLAWNPVPLELDYSETWLPVEIPFEPRVKKAPKAAKKPRVKKTQPEASLPEGTNVLDLKDETEEKLEQAV